MNQKILHYADTAHDIYVLPLKDKNIRELHRDLKKCTNHEQAECIGTAYKQRLDDLLDEKYASGALKREEQETPEKSFRHELKSLVNNTVNQIKVGNTVFKKNSLQSLTEHLNRIDPQPKSNTQKFLAKLGL